MPTEREQPKDKFSRLPSLEKVSRDPVEYYCFGCPTREIGKEGRMYRLNSKLFLPRSNKYRQCSSLRPET